MQRGLCSTYGIERDRTKTAAGTREVLLDSDTLRMVREHFGNRRTGLLFQTRLGTHLKVSDVNRFVLKPLCKRLGIPPATCHSFRHGRVSQMVANGLPEKFIQEQVGHVDKQITRHYTHIGMERMTEMVNLLAASGQKPELWPTVN